MSKVKKQGVSKLAKRQGKDTKLLVKVFKSNTGSILNIKSKQNYKNSDLLTQISQTFPKLF